MLVERVKRIADYVTERSGVYVSDRMVKRLARREHDPLPGRKFGAPVVADEKELAAWIARQ